MNASVGVIGGFALHGIDNGEIVRVRVIACGPCRGLLLVVWE